MELVDGMRERKLIGVYFNWKIDYRIFGGVELGK